jgi:hypothetical protein
MDRWLSSPKIFDHLWVCKTKAVGTVMANRQEVPKEAFSGELKKSETYHAKGITSWSSSARTSVMTFS